MDPDQRLDVVYYIISIPRDTAVHPEFTMAYRNDEPGTIVKGSIIPIELPQTAWEAKGRYYVYDALDADTDRFRVAIDLEGELEELTDASKEFVETTVNGMDEIVYVLPYAALAINEHISTQ